MWVYQIATGLLLHDGADGLKQVATCYSGYGPAKNDVTACNQAGLGPIPLGVYWIGEAFESDHSGPNTMRLIPVTPGTNTFGRDAFELHGDSKSHPGAASHGCICAPPGPRQLVADSHDRLLCVVSGKLKS